MMLAAPMLSGKGRMLLSRWERELTEQANWEIILVLRVLVLHHQRFIPMLLSYIPPNIILSVSL